VAGRRVLPRRPVHHNLAREAGVGIDRNRAVDVCAVSRVGKYECRASVRPGVMPRPPIERCSGDRDPKEPEPARQQAQQSGAYGDESNR